MRSEGGSGSHTVSHGPIHQPWEHRAPLHSSFLSALTRNRKVRHQRKFSSHSGLSVSPTPSYKWYLPGAIKITRFPFLDSWIRDHFSIHIYQVRTMIPSLLDYSHCYFCRLNVFKTYISLDWFSFPVITCEGVLKRKKEKGLQGPQART